ncbi:MAG: T9SS type A sorting domain-containing protein [Bacteroidia bacterium]|nr:T9SS type A sorting domain-containing protein [Bacteroidia bacterium]
MKCIINISQFTAKATSLLCLASFSLAFWSFNAHATDINILVSTLDGLHTAENTASELNTNTGGSPTFANSSDGWLFVDKGDELRISAFDIGSRNEPITAVLLKVKYSVEAGYTGTNWVQYSNGTLTNTDSEPTNGESDIEDVTFDLKAAGVDTWSEIAALDIHFDNNDAGGADGVSFDYIYITVTYTPLPDAPTLLSTGGTDQLAFNNSHINDNTPMFRAKATHSSTYNRMYIEVNTAADFTGTAYTQTFSGTYTSATEYNFDCTALSTALPTTDGVTYYVRAKASDDGGSNYGSWSSGTYSFTYKSAATAVAWFQTTEEQFDDGTLTNVDAVTSDQVQLEYILDDFTDGDYTASPVWTVKAGSHAVTSNVLEDLNVSASNIISTPLTQTSGYWEFKYQFSTTTHTGSMFLQSFFYLNESNFTSTSDGYMVIVRDDASSEKLVLQRVDNGALTDIITASGITYDANQHTILLTVDGSGNWELFWDGTSKGTVIDATYSSPTHWVSRHYESLGTATIGIDDLKYGAASGTDLSSGFKYSSVKSASAWDKITWNDTETKGDIKYSVYYESSGATIIPDAALTGNAAGFDDGSGGIDISGLSTSTYAELYLKATMTPTDGGPSLQDWTITPKVQIGDADSKAEAPASQTAATTVSSLKDTDAEAQEVFKFKITDLSTADTYVTKVTQIKIKTGASNNADWTTNIQGAKLYDVDGAAFVTITSATITDNDIVIAIPSGNLDIADGGSTNLALYVYLNTSSIVDGAIMDFRIDYDDHGFTADGGAGSDFTATFGSADIEGNNMTIAVVATKMIYTTDKPKANTSTDTDFDVTVTAVDANNNVDTDRACSITLSRGTGTGTLSSVTGLTQNLSSGTYSWTDVRHNTIEDITIIATDNDCSLSSSTVTSITIDVGGMYYSSSTVTQDYSSYNYGGLVGKGETNQELLEIRVVVINSDNDISISSFTFDVELSTAEDTDIDVVKIWATGTSSTFATTTQLGADITPNFGDPMTINSGANMPYTFTVAGTYYFWVTVDIDGTNATFDNVVDGKCTSIIVDGAAKTPTTTSPSGSRTISKAWQGGTSTDWGLAANWVGGVPTSSDNIFIPNETNDPLMTATSACKSMTIESGAVLTVTLSGSETFGIYGSLTNDGEISVTSAGTSVPLNFWGTGPVNWGGSGTYTGTVGGDFYINPSVAAAVTLTANIDLGTSGYLNIAANDSLVMSTYTVKTQTIIQTGYIQMTTGTLEFTETTPTLVEARFGEGTGTVYYNVTGSYDVNDLDTYYNLKVKHSGANLIELDTYTCQNLTIIPDGSPTSNVEHLAGTDVITINGNLTIDASAELQGFSTGKFVLKGNFTNNGTFDTPATSEFKFNGSSAQTISGNAVTFDDLVIDNSSGGVALTIDGTVKGTLTMTNGDLTISTGKKLTLEDLDDPGISGGGTSTMIITSGTATVEKTYTSTTKLTFPMGDGTNYRPLAITPSNTNSTVWTMSYTASGQGDTDVDGSGLNHVSTNEYWTLDRSVSSPADAIIELTWTSNNSVDNYATLEIAHYDGTTDWDMIAATPTGDNTSGTIVSDANVTSFSPFTLGSSDAANPLPIKLLNFDAKVNGQFVDITWTTATEANNDFFTIEKSVDDLNYELVTTLDGAGNSNTTLYYKITDENPFPGTSYYRLKQTDYDGNSKVFPSIPVTFTSTKFELISIHPNPADITTTISFYALENDVATLKLYNTLGQEMNVIQKRTQAGVNQFVLDVSNYRKGIYFIQLENSRLDIVQSKLVKTNFYY